ncbi:hypothetical protein YC2023_033675 [Brassica napus]
MGLLLQNVTNIDEIPPCLALPPPHNSHCDHRWSCLIHHQASSASSPSFTKNKQKSDSKRERQRQRQREICRTVVEWWWTASVTSNDGRQRDHSFNYSTCTKIKAMQKRDDGSKTYNKRPLTEAVEDGER